MNMENLKRILEKIKHIEDPLSYIEIAVDEKLKAGKKKSI